MKTHENMAAVAPRLPSETPASATPEQEEQWRRADEETRRKLPSTAKLFRSLRGHTAWIGRIAWAPDGRILASPSGDGTIRLWDLEVGSELRTLDGYEGHKGWVYGVSFDATGNTLASCSDDQTVRLWDLNERSNIHTFRKHKGNVLGVAFHPSGTIASGSADQTVKFWDVQSGTLLWNFDKLRGPVVSLAFSPAGTSLAIAGNDHTVLLLDFASRSVLRILERHQGFAQCVAFDPSGTILASGSDDKTVKLWNTTTGKLIRTLEGHKSTVVAVAFSPDGRLLASKGNDNTVRLWSLDSGAPLAVIAEPSSGRSTPSISFHPKLPLLAIVASDPGANERMQDSIVHVLELDFAGLLAKAAGATVSYISAKVVLVGESNVGKSYLAHRIVTGLAPEKGLIKSTHGMKFWPLAPERLSPKSKAPPWQRREVVLWDMGGQEEYRLIHQMFLHDTTVALLLLDPTRGTTAFKEVETWNKYLDKQLHGRSAVKLLVGAKLDEPSSTIDRQGLDRLCRTCGFKGYFESSALSGRGLQELCDGLSTAIDWEGLGQTSRPELFQAIREEIDARRRRGTVVVLFDDLNIELHTKKESPIFSLIHQEIATESDDQAGKSALDAVCGQLSKQGLIADCRTSGGKRALVLRLEEVERYAGSLILAARNNPRGVPALESKAIVRDDFDLPGISHAARLPRDQERAILECTVQLMLEHGICFQHEGLLVFPSLFAPVSEVIEAKLPHAVALYYDFSGAIDNIYASLVAWLVLAQNFGKVRLWSERAEFEIKDGGLCGLRKVGRPGGFAHVDVYFEPDTPERQRKEFISFVEDHLVRNGVEIREHVAIRCGCGHEFAEETLRQRIARGEKDVRCPVCELQHNLTQGAAEARARDPMITQQTWALRTQIERRRVKITKQVVQTLAKAEKASPTQTPIRLLHLSDLHFTASTQVTARLQWLLDDLKRDGGLGFKDLDYLVISGDFTDKGCTAGFEKAYEFVSGLTQAFGLSAERCIFVPGNHDVRDLREAYDWREGPDGLRNGEWVKQGDIVLARNPEKYSLRLKPFSDSFFHKFLQRPYPLDSASQGAAVPFWETGIQFLVLNSCWQIDQFHRKRSGVSVEAVANAIRQAQKQEDDARKAGQLAEGRSLLRIAVWHHAVAGPEQMKDTDFLGNLQKNGVCLALHGDVHEERCDLIGYQTKQKLHVVGSGSFGARAEDRPESSPRLYNVLEIARNLKSVRVHTRCQPKPDGPWKGWHEWDDPDGSKGKVAFYDVRFGNGANP